MEDLLKDIKKSWALVFNHYEIKNGISAVINKISDFNNVYPKKEDIFKVFKLLDFENVKVIILGQDPYHTKNVANGIAFSANKSAKTPQSLRNIFKELKNDLYIDHFDNNDLSEWVKQGVLLINTSLTVVESNPGSHADYGWKEIVLKIIKFLYNKNKNIIFCLWGNFAKNLYNNLNINSDYVIISAHPSPFSYKRGFANSKPFSRINSFLDNLGLEVIDWSR
ncbi:uracil-DNA glycosylase [Spiroplasma tabanidicola]|uniref:Uracil-DNA glycosylase n=1 Tax=Spiroplasma tabanidicola TaxID=324079 RepID=A0A6I6C6I7_9MOLU|nr:uracil-DNA glycosylase [Spiroplasma tabanidicola]QGS51396.1 uracil-DNA glycosylase [Spiroplasma tabanidicola]